MAHTFVIFGASGDLTSRKLIPALYQLHRKGRLPPDTSVVGFSRTEFSNEAWRTHLTETTKEFAGDQFVPETWNEFAQRIYYHVGDINKREDFASLAKMLPSIESNAPATRVYYLSTAPRWATASE